MQNEEDVQALSRVLTGKTLKALDFTRADELRLEFGDGSRLFIEVGFKGLELSMIRVCDWADEIAF